VDKSRQSNTGHIGVCLPLFALFGDAKPPTMSKTDYYVHIKRTGPFQSKWEWRILRRSKEIDVGIYARGFATAEAARRSGEIALKKLLANPALVPASGQLEWPRRRTTGGESG
jgi:hypothetical protein